jgi:exopolyphosphatase/guanosine-5'-triphosphate,3'-diphosphate pyrophosphatase
MTYAAAIDIGTHSALLVIAKRRGNKISPQIDLARTTKLGEALTETKQLNPAAIERLMGVLKTYQAILSEYPVEHPTVFGTAAFRLAQNAELCRQAIADQFGWSLRILSGEEEAVYTFRGVTQLLMQGETVALPRANPQVLAIDIGGGSTEVISGLPGQIQQQWSIPVGAVLLKQQFDLGERLSLSTIQQIEQFLTNHFTRMQVVSPPDQVWVTGGTATTLAALLQEMTEYDFRRIDGYTCSLESIEMLFHELNQLTNNQRADLPGMEAGREDVILPALVILRTLLDYFSTYAITVSIRGARYGILGF